MSWESQTFRSLWSHALLNLEMIQVQKVKGCMKEIRFKESPIQHMSGWHSWISIKLLNQWWSVAKFNFQLEATIFCCNLLKPFDVNFVQKCQICVICENLEWIDVLLQARKNSHVTSIFTAGAGEFNYAQTVVWIHVFKILQLLRKFKINSKAYSIPYQSLQPPTHPSRMQHFSIQYNPLPKLWNWR